MVGPFGWPSGTCLILTQGEKAWSISPCFLPYPPVLRQSGIACTQHISKTLEICSFSLFITWVIIFFFKICQMLLLIFFFKLLKQGHMIIVGTLLKITCLFFAFGLAAINFFWDTLLNFGGAELAWSTFQNWSFCIIAFNINEDMLSYLRGIKINF